MADNTSLQKSIDMLRVENAKDAENKQSRDLRQEKELVSLNKNFKKFLDGVAGGKKDEEEERRDGKKKKPSSAGSPIGDMASELKGANLGIGSMIGVLTAAVAGLAFGIAETIGRFVKNILPKSFLNAFSNMKNAFIAGTNGVKSVSKTTKGAFKSMGFISSAINKVGKMFFLIGKGFEKVGKIASNIRATVSGGISKGVTTMQSAFKTLTKPFTAISKALGATTKSTGLFTTVFGKISGFFSNLGKGIKLPNMQIFSKVFTAFRAIGGKIPVIGQIIAAFVGVFNGIKDAFAQAGDIGDKLIRFLTSGFGNALGFFVGGLVDLVKDGVSWILSKFDFTKGVSEWLDSFSFEKMIIDIFDKFGDIVIDFKANVSEFISNFSIGDLIGSISEGFFGMIDSMKEAITGGIASLKDRIANFSIGDALAGALDWAHEMGETLKSFIRSALPDPDSWKGALVPDMIYDWVGEAKPEPKVVKEESGGELDPVDVVPEDALTQKDVIGITAEEQASNMASMQAARDALSSDGPIEEDDFHMQNDDGDDDLDSISAEDVESNVVAIDPETAAFLKELESPEFIAEAKAKREKREADMVKMEEEAAIRKAEFRKQDEENYRLTLLRREEGYKMMLETGIDHRSGKELTDAQRKMAVSGLERIDKIQARRGFDVDQMSKENAMAQQQAPSVNVMAPSSSNVTNNTAQTSAVMDNNHSTVDPNDRVASM
jgi:acetolactate synthase regulatory subunit